METSTFQIRTARRQDLPALLGLYRDLTGIEPWAAPAEPQEVFERFHAFAGSAVIVGELGGELVASCALVVVPNLTRGGRSSALIENVVTHADHRKRGLGRAVLDAALDRAWAAGCYKVMLATGSKRPETLRFYAAAGFEPDAKTYFEAKRPEA